MTGALQLIKEVHSSAGDEAKPVIERAQFALVGREDEDDSSVVEREGFVRCCRQQSASCFKVNPKRKYVMNGVTTFRCLASRIVLPPATGGLPSAQPLQQTMPGGLPSVCLRCARKYHLQPLSYLHPPYRNLHSVRRLSQHGQFEPLRPPSPFSLPKPALSQRPPRLRKWLRRLLYTSVTVGAVWYLDTRLYDSVLTRSGRTFVFGTVAALDYKINFRAHPPFAKSIQHLHARNAQMLCDLLSTNGGLYLKIGQAIAMQSAILPPEFQKMFAKMFDDAPQNSWQEVRKVIEEDFGKSVEDVFGVSFEPADMQAGRKGIMERTARASASVAQVHWARLDDGREVAIKIQKREIQRQVGWDLWAFK
ncbi:MAG: hypothetical protein M1822_008121 [Bathelium mastoideum]|nr:MAG: hypothetical protein M1822_008121 [Bathelium mastoideum]